MGGKIITPGDLREPRIVTFEELKRVLGPYLKIAGPSAILELHDLWKMGAPTPDSGPGRVEKRILLPSQFNKWWNDLMRRYGMALSAKETLRGLPRH